MPRPRSGCPLLKGRVRMILERIGIIRAPPHVVLRQDHGNRVDQQPDEAADKRAIQTDELKVTTDVELEFSHDLVILPVFHLARDEATDPWAQFVQYAGDCTHDLFVDRRQCFLALEKRRTKRNRH